MRNVEGMEILQGFEDIQEDDGCLCFCKNNLFFYEPPEIPFFGILHDQVDALIVFDDFVEFDDVSMPDAFEDLDFFVHFLINGFFLKPAFVEDLDRNFLLSFLMDCDLNLPKTAFADGLAHDKSFHLYLSRF